MCDFLLSRCDSERLGAMESPEGKSLSDSPVDFDLMDELLSSGDCWLDNYSDLNIDNFSSSSPSFSFLYDSLNNASTLIPTQSDALDAQQREPSNETLTQLEQTSNWSIRPRLPIIPLKERLFHALNFIKEAERGIEILVQIWVPTTIKRGDKDKNFLTTMGQPFLFEPNCESLAKYRSVSTEFHFSADASSNELLGLPGRVFIGKVPEWTPDVRYFSVEEYARVDQAQRLNVSGTIALPVFERDGQSCIGVVEVVLTTQKINYSSDIEKICNALQAVDLRSSDILQVPQVKVIDNSYQAVLAEIRDVLKTVCRTQGLPLAQTWIPCTQQGKQGSRHSSENYEECVSTVDSACYIHDPSMLGFHEACSEHHLFRGQGVVGKAFAMNQPCFSPDITSFIKTHYPLSHHSKLFRLRAAVAIRLRCVRTGNLDFVLEFFLPVDCVESEEQKRVLNSLSVTIREVCRSLRVVTDEELDEEAMLGVDRSFSSVLFDDEFLSEGGQRQDNGISADQRGSFSSDINCQRAAKGIEKRRAKTEKTISLEVLRQYFAGSLKDAAKTLGVCPTTLKRICRQHGITRWPSRKIKKVGHSLKKLQVVIDSVQGAGGTFQFSSVYENFATIQPPPHLPESSNTLQNSSNTSSSACSLSSNSSFGGSTGSKFPIKQEASTDENQALKLVRASGEAELHGSTREQQSRAVARSQSHRALVELKRRPDRTSLESPSRPLKRRSDVLKVKAVYGEEKVRLRLQPDWGIEELKREILQRFNVSNNACSFDLKYLDDDSEWVLLTCDADLQECVDVYKSSCGDTIKMSVHRIAASCGPRGFSS